MRVGLLCLAACGRVGFDPGATDGVQPTYPEAVLADHPVAYYRLNELAGGMALDSSGNGRDAIYEVGDGGLLYHAVPGALADDPAVGMVGDGNQSNPPGYASILMPPEAFAFAGDFTIEGWVSPGAPPPGFNNSFFIWERYNVSGFRTGWNDNLNATLWCSESGGSGEVEAGAPLAVGQWAYLVFTRSGNTFAVYVDGALADENTLDYVTPDATGANAFGSDHGLPGGDVYDELAIYDHVLDASRIAAHYAAAGRH